MRKDPKWVLVPVLIFALLLIISECRGQYGTPYSLIMFHSVEEAEIHVDTTILISQTQGLYQTFVEFDGFRLSIETMEFLKIGEKYFNTFIPYRETFYYNGSVFHNKNGAEVEISINLSTDEIEINSECGRIVFKN